MKRQFVLGSVVLGFLVLVASIASVAATSSSTSSAQYRLGETVLFKIASYNTCWWCCCCCESTCANTEVLGWHVSDACGVWVYSVVHDVPVSASTWQGSWSQINSSGAQVPAGYYKLNVETSVGTLSHCLKLYDPCSSCCWNPCRCLSPCSCRSRCSCKEMPSIADCCCRTSLELVLEKSNCCPSFRWPCSSSCP